MTKLAFLVISISCLLRITASSSFAFFLSSILFVSSSLICLCISACLSYCSNNILDSAAAICADFANAWFVLAVSIAASILISFKPSTTFVPISPTSVIASPKLFTISFPAFIAALPIFKIFVFVSVIARFNSFIVLGSPSPKNDFSQANIAPCTANFIPLKINFKLVNAIVTIPLTTLPSASKFSVADDTFL